MSSANWQPVLVTQKLRHFRKVRHVFISWYHQLHVQICVVKHIWREISVGVRHIQLIYDTIKLFLKVQAIFEVLG